MQKTEAIRGFQIVSVCILRLFIGLNPALLIQGDVDLVMVYAQTFSENRMLTLAKAVLTRLGLRGCLVLCQLSVFVLNHLSNGAK